MNLNMATLVCLLVMTPVSARIAEADDFLARELTHPTIQIDGVRYAIIIPPIFAEYSSYLDANCDEPSAKLEGKRIALLARVWKEDPYSYTSYKGRSVVRYPIFIDGFSRFSLSSMYANFASASPLGDQRWYTAAQCSEPPLAFHDAPKCRVAIWGVLSYEPYGFDGDCMLTVEGYEYVGTADVKKENVGSFWDSFWRGFFLGAG